ncbi:MAG: FkbM family methyltransferase [Pseudomonadota bacterium]|nr:FkbM family methyltransferase [Pseudomonadota bacterium]
MVTRNVQSEVDFYSQFISPGDVAIDVGAHIGDSTLAFAVCAGIDGHVYGLEPNPATFQILASFCLVNRSRVSITPVPWALGLADGSSNFQYGDYWLDNGGYHEESVFSHGSTYDIPVKVVTLETFLSVINLKLGDVAFIKLDIEGADLAIVEDIVASGGNDVPIIQFEVLDGLPDLDLRLKTLASKFLLLSIISDPVTGLRLVELDVAFLRTTGQVDVILIPHEVYENLGFMV